MEEEKNDLGSQAVPAISQHYVEQVKTQKNELLAVQASIIELKELINKLAEMAKKKAAIAESEKQFSAQTEENQRQKSILKEAVSVKSISIIS